MKKKPTTSEAVALWLFVVLLLSIIALGGITLVQKRNTSTANAEISQTEPNIEPYSEPTTQPSPEPTNAPEAIPTFDFENVETESEAILLADLDGNEYFSENKNKKVYPASLTKIMTAIVAIENIDDINETVMITGEIPEMVSAENGSVAGFIAYEEVSYRDLLYGTVLCSGAECCYTLANYIAGSEWDFVEMMNQKAETIGMKNTNFTNCCGFHDIDHYSTAADISVLLKYALENDTFYEIFTSQEYYTVTNQHPDGINLTSTMFSEMESPEISGGEILGGKTGFTDEAGLCLASIAEVDGKLYTLVTTGALGSHETEPLHIYDAINIYENLSVE